MKMIIRLVLIFLLSGFVSLTSIAQNGNDFKTITVNKIVRDFPVKYDQDTPMDGYLSISNILAYGKKGLLRQYSTYRFYDSFPKEGTPDKQVSDTLRNEMLGREIKECIVYKDSVAAVITTSEEDSLYYIRYLSKENGKWVNAGENIGKGIEKTRQNIINSLPVLASFIPMIEVIKQTPTDTLNFVNYLRTKGKRPDQYILEKLAKHKIVIYGEYHRRTVSWNLLTQLIQKPGFAKTTGTVFFELPSHKQKDLDRFYAQKELDKSILFSIFGCEQINGWHDKDEFDFMIALWKLNNKLPENQKIKVVLTDFQIPWDSIKTAEELKNFQRKDRNTSMADVIEHTIKTTKDKRNTLFIVGFMHAHKSSQVSGIASTPTGMVPAPTAGAQLVKRFSNKDVFCIFPHCMSGSNQGGNGGKIRNGFFDYLFDRNNNLPVAFDLVGSPFGGEPFDADSDVKFNPKIGHYEDNYDGYIFFQKLTDEVKGNPLYELFTDEYVEELKRRIRITGVKDTQVWGYNTPVKDLTKEIIINAMKQYANGKMWNFDK